MDWLSFAQSFGFPALCCVAMGIYIYKTDANRREETKSFIKSVNNQTHAVESLSDLIKKSLERKEE